MTSFVLQSIFLKHDPLTYVIFASVTSYKEYYKALSKLDFNKDYFIIDWIKNGMIGMMNEYTRKLSTFPTKLIRKYEQHLVDNRLCDVRMELIKSCMSDMYRWVDDTLFSHRNFEKELIVMIETASKMRKNFPMKIVNEVILAADCGILWSNEVDWELLHQIAENENMHLLSELFCSRMHRSYPCDVETFSDYDGYDF